MTVEYLDGFAIAMNYSDKEYEMSLPAKTKILVGDKKDKNSWSSGLDGGISYLELLAD